jgi:hypothetical protein
MLALRERQLPLLQYRELGVICSGNEKQGLLAGIFAVL